MPNLLVYNDDDVVICPVFSKFGLREIITRISMMDYIQTNYPDFSYELADDISGGGGKFGTWEIKEWMKRDVIEIELNADQNVTELLGPKGMEIRLERGFNSNCGIEEYIEVIKQLMKARGLSPIWINHDKPNQIIEVEGSAYDMETRKSIYLTRLQKSKKEQKRLKDILQS